jgi:hypothetical protein
VEVVGGIDLSETSEGREEEKEGARRDAEREGGKRQDTRVEEVWGNRFENENVS